MIGESDLELFPDHDIVKVVEGGMGRIYHLRERTPEGRQLIAKTLRQELASIPQYYRRFIEEAQLFMSLDPHPFVAQPIGFDSSRGQPFILMHWIDGWTLSEWAVRNASLKLPRPTSLSDWTRWWQAWAKSEDHPFHPAGLLYYMYQVCVALEWLYSQGIDAHGDIHGNNIMLGRGFPSYAILIDLGLARATELMADNVLDFLPLEGKKHMVGCVPFMAPELISEKAAPNHCTDVYALGVSMYVSLTNHFPYAQRFPLNDLRTLRNVAAAGFDRPHQSEIRDISDRYRNCLQRCIALQPKQRFKDASELKEEAEGILWEDYRMEFRIEKDRMTDGQMREYEEHQIDRAITLAETPNKLNEALAILRDVLSRNPDHVRALHSLAQTLYDNGNYEEADGVISRAMQLDSTSFYVLNTQGIIHNALGHYEKAITVLNRALDASKNRVQKQVALGNLSIALRKSKKEREAERYLSDALALGEEYRSLFEKAKIAYETEQWETAAEFSERALKVNPAMTEAFNLWGSALRNIDRSEEAYQVYKQGLLIDPDNADMLVGMAYAAAESGRSRGEILALLDRAESAGRDDLELNVLRALAMDGEKGGFYAAKALQQNPSNEPLRSLLERQWKEREHQPLSEIHLPMEALYGRGISDETMVACSQAIFRVVQAVQNTDVPITKKILTPMLSGVDRRAVCIVCEEILAVKRANRSPSVDRVMTILEGLYKHLSLED